MSTKKQEEYLGIKINYERDKEIPEQGIALLTGQGFYKKEWEESPQESFARAATCFSFGDNAFAQRIYNYVSNQWFMFASPVLSNAVEITWPKFNKHQFSKAAEWLKANVKPDGMPISCFLSYVGDSKQALVAARSEAAWLSMMGGGVGIYMGNRSPDKLSTGVMSHLKGYDADTLSYRQTATRRGSMAAYLDISHPEIKSFIQMRNPAGGDQNKKCFNINNAVNIPDAFMEAVIAGEEYELVDPKHGKTGNTVSAREVWEELMKVRFESGEPYMLFIDTVNKNIPKWITKPTYHVKQSNLCSEITLMTSLKRTAVCCLSSVNLETYDEWKNDAQFIEDLIRLLDNVLEYFIQLAPDYLNRAVYSAKKERAVGLGSFGYHSYLQSKMIPMESGFMGAAGVTHEIYKNLKDKAVAASKVLASDRGEPDDCKGSGMRNSHLLAIAPNASSASLVGASPSTEPWAGNAFTAQGRAGSFLVKNKYLEKILEERGFNTPETWSKIIADEGSARGVECLTDEEKKVFGSAYEISPMWLIELAGIRQEHVCQSQSTNIFIPEGVTLQELSDIHMKAWQKKLKSLYYCRTKPAAKAQIGTGGEKPLNAVPVRTKIEFDNCLACEG